MDNYLLPANRAEFMTPAFFAQRFQISEDALFWAIAKVTTDEGETVFPVLSIRSTSLMIDIQRDTLLTLKNMFHRQFRLERAVMSEREDTYCFTSLTMQLSLKKDRLFSLYEGKILTPEMLK